MLPVAISIRSHCYKWMQLLILSSTVFLGACENLQVATTSDESDAINKVRTGRFELIEKTQLAQLKKDAEVGRASAERVSDIAELNRCVQIRNPDTRMGQSSGVRVISGDLRPLWRVSGRVQHLRIYVRGC